VRVLFIHQNFPAQYVHIARHLVQEGGHQLIGIAGSQVPDFEGVQLIKYTLPEKLTNPEKAVKGLHPYTAHFDEMVTRGDLVLHACAMLSQKGFKPDVIAAHSGWGEALFLKAIWPDVPLVVFSEFFYRAEGADIGFDSEFQSTDLGSKANVHAKNAHLLHGLQTCDVAVSPTHWQKSVVPPEFMDKVKVAHDGINTESNAPSTQEINLTMPSGKILKKGQEILTFVNRQLEPYRGYHVFMRALPRIMKERPNCEVILIGGDGTSYGKRPPQGQTWKEVFLNPVKDQLDMDRVHFVGRVPYPSYQAVLKCSSAHVYLTYPFVLSWSLMESMSTGCAVIASDTAPVREVITNNKNGLLFPFFDHEALATKVVKVLKEPKRYAKMREAARQTIVENYDLKTVCLPKQFEILRAAMERREPVLSPQVDYSTQKKLKAG
jgi:glycosyltransferase involved in cell wall biosynthesis